MLTADFQPTKVAESSSIDAARVSRPTVGSVVSVAMIEPVGSHGGADYYDTGLMIGLAANGVRGTWYTCDKSSPRGSEHVDISRTYTAIWGADAAWRRGLRFVRGIFLSLVQARSRCERIAHFHFFHVGPLEVLSVALARLFSLRPVATIHDVEAFTPGGKSRLLRFLAYRQCAYLIVHNKVSRLELIERCEVDPDKIKVIPHGSYVGLIPARSGREDAHRALALPKGKRILLFFGQIKEVKGLDILLQAFAKVRDRVEGAHLVIAGKVWKDDFTRYQVLIDKLNLRDSVSLHIRYIPDDEIGLFYGAADIVVLPYRKIYQSGVLLMAMSYGVPVIASNLPGMTEVIEAGRNGFIFESGDPVNLAEQLTSMLANNDVLRATADAAVVDMQTRYNWTAIGARTLAVYAEALRNGR